jgi:hypothetical protein
MLLAESITSGGAFAYLQLFVKQLERRFSFLKGDRPLLDKHGKFLHWLQLNATKIQPINYFHLDNKLPTL